MTVTETETGTETENGFAIVTGMIEETPETSEPHGIRGTRGMRGGTIAALITARIGGETTGDRISDLSVAASALLYIPNHLNRKSKRRS